MMLSLYHKATTRRTGTVKKQLQIQQCSAINEGVLGAMHSATAGRFKHPLRYLEERSFLLLFQTAAIHNASALYQGSMNPDRTPIPGMPRIKELSRFTTMGI